MKNLMPSTEAKNHLDTKTGEVKPAIYRQGSPRQYRFNASTGVLNLNGVTTLTKPGKEFKIIPIGIRIFIDNLFESGRKSWAEVFFLNAANQVCSLMFHGYSVENLTKLDSEIFYEGLSIDEIILTVEPESKTSKTVDEAGKNPKYYIADFSFEKANETAVKAQQEATKNLTIYRADTWNPDATLVVGYKYPNKEVTALLAPPEPAPTTQETNTAETATATK